LFLNRGDLVLFNSYTISETQKVLAVIWGSPSLPEGLRWGCVFLLTLLPALFLFRLQIARGAARFVPNIAPSPRTVGLLAPGLSLLLGGLLWFTQPSEPLIEWIFSPEGVFLKSPRGAVRLRWDEIASIRLDDRNPDPELASLILKTKDGREAWIILEWLEPLHREKILSRLEAERPGQLPPSIPREPH
jgi:hypothetical protein